MLILTYCEQQQPEVEEKLSLREGDSGESWNQHQHPLHKETDKGEYSKNSTSQETILLLELT